MKSSQLPPLPVPHNELVNYIAQRPNAPLAELMEPYRQYEAKLREMYAQDRDNAVLDDPHLNVLPLFTKDTSAIQTRARDLERETQDQKDKYIMPLADDKRRPNGSPAVVGSLKEFQHNFGIFSESSLSDMNWNNVVAAGSSVVNTLLPVPPNHKKSKRALRKYYHEIFCPASDVDLFLYGLTKDQAVQKLKDIETHIRDAILSEVTVVRTKNAITICSQYPTRHVQIVLRLYKSVSEILAGFDIDCACAAYDGQQVYVAPRALASYISQVNPIDLSRRSPSYENRLSKYSHRNFEVYWPELDRSRVDPTLFERSFPRTLGLARLLLLEQLPTADAREEYLKKRRKERGRPELVNNRFHHLPGDDIKNIHEDEVADWVHDDELSNYHTFTLPYGPKYHAKKIEKLCYTRDLLLNAEWNQTKERGVYLHRHPAFFGRVEDVLKDCCGTCPKPQTPEEIEIAQKEGETHVTGNLMFRNDDPGRQAIGSFNPLTEDDWTEMAYVGNTARLCQAIVDNDLEYVKSWLSQQGADPNRRDYTGRTPLHLAVISSTPDIVKCLVDHGARLIARIADGRTALHLAAARGDVEIVQILLEKSNLNEEEEADKQDLRRKAHEETAADRKPDNIRGTDASDDLNSEHDGELIDDSSDDGVKSMATGSFVKVDNNDKSKSTEALPIDDDQSDPDFYKIDVVAWDSKCSALHLAILGGHCEVVELLCQEFGADPLIPVKMEDGAYNKPNYAILTLNLALALPVEKVIRMCETLLRLGATSSQADAHGATALHRYIQSGNAKIFEALWENDKLGIKRAINHLAIQRENWYANVTSPLMTALDQGNPTLVTNLLETGAEPEIHFEHWLQGAKFNSEPLRGFDANQSSFQDSTEQPLLVAIQSPRPTMALNLLERGVDPNALTKDSHRILRSETWRRQDAGRTALDVVRNLLSELREYDAESAHNEQDSSTFETAFKPHGTTEFLSQFLEGTYRHWLVSADIDVRMELYRQKLKNHNEENKRVASREGRAEKIGAIRDVISQLERVEGLLLEKGAKTYKELYLEPEGIVLPLRANFNTSTSQGVYDFELGFRNVNDLTAARQLGYIELFEAAWAGDLEIIKSLTQAPWGPDANQPPLEISVQDLKGNSPFSLAFLRGHLDIARAILEIARAQWSPAEEGNACFQMTRPDGDEEAYIGFDGYTSHEKIEGFKETTFDQFTIDNIGQVPMQVKSGVTLSTILSWTGPTFVSKGDKAEETKLYPRDLLTFSITEDDSQRFDFLLDYYFRLASTKPECYDQEESDTFSAFPEAAFEHAIAVGQTHMLAQAIRQFGAGIPLDHLVKKKGVEMKVKPRYYQGLTVYGKKRADWAKKPTTFAYYKSPDNKLPPLLTAALMGSLESVQWFLSDVPMRCYSEFGKSQVAKEDPRLKHANESLGAFDRTVARWLGIQNDFVIHCAILGSTGDDRHELIKYLIKTCPSSLEAKSDLGYTPLYLACLYGRVQFAATLIHAGADQSVKDKESNNIVHACLTNEPKLNSLRRMLGLFDPDLRAHLFRQRNNLVHGGDAPLHYWLKIANISRDSYTYSGGRALRTIEPEKPGNSDILKLLLEYTESGNLETLNGSGDTALHTAVLRSLPAQTRILIEHDPKLLYRENAVGRTPAEIACDIFVNDRVVAPEPIGINTNYGDIFAKKLVGREPESFLSEVGPPKSRVHATWDVVQEYTAKTEGKRRLVSLNEANDVARRLVKANLQQPSRAKSSGDDEDDEESSHEQENFDAVNIALLSTRTCNTWLSE